MGGWAGEIGMIRNHRKGAASSGGKEYTTHNPSVLGQFGKEEPLRLGYFPHAS
jgi:hypothetical protein